MSAPGSGLERRLLRSHVAVAALGGFTLLIALVATTWLRSNNLRLASQRGPTVRATTLASNGLHYSAEALYGWIVSEDVSFRQARMRAWREQIRPAIAELERLDRRWPEAIIGEQLARLQPVLADLRDWQFWIEDVAASEGNIPAEWKLERHGGRLVVEAGRLVRSISTLAPPLGHRASEFSSAMRLAHAHLGRLVENGSGNEETEALRELDRARHALSALGRSAHTRGAEVGELIARLDTVLGSFEVLAGRVIADRRAPDWNIAQQLLVEEAIPTTQLATNLLTTLTVKQEELMLADAARVEWFSNVTVIAGVLLLLALGLTAVIASRRHAARITCPIRELSVATARLAEGKFDGELPVRGDDELARLSRSFNAMRRALSERSAALARRTGELERANRTLERRNAELDEFTYVASHDLQEPLRKLVSFSKLLRMDLGADLPEQASKDLEFITRAAQRMQSLVQDLLTLSRTGRAAMSRQETALDACVDAALEQLDVQIAETNADISRDELPQAIVDATLVTQLFQNLIGNAIKFHAPGQRPSVRITCERDGDEHVIGVRDRGIGLKKEYAEQIFTPFKRLHGRDAYEGTGIGLAICRKAVARHGGRIWVESEPGAGAHFRFTLGAETRMSQCREAA